MSATLRHGGSLLLGILLLLPLLGEDDPIDPIAEESSVEEILGRTELLDPESEEVKEAQEKAPSALLPSPEEMAEPEKKENLSPEAPPEDAPILPLIQNAGDGPGKIEGVIFDREGAGIPRALLTFPDLGGLQLRTDRQGKFSLTGLPVGPVAVEILKPSYLTRLEVIEVKAEGVTSARSDSDVAYFTRCP
ncbi:carboxypeptidase-like regulatory domain-containing protein [Akkermansiaceae bacterium]|nr:carboxypeptidase-like regulatory domain-containing protein [Akkermansiaceae bacterium]MDB4412527.1 carboxypeptidase-like regulatory domain-containing protein [bacterium]MDB4041675.1 carboxypeptidase-like regulatory domain-containing protein [Akkermansiaceae bacterium]MDB4630679.1 carboxypeptidase-like regulatory domain-containing protein [Akkermansiaceae bacterium]MDB4681978.1 carboxypeptidase-like regulatory domain-containing protein [Akkermansiaceae bacterium]